MRTITNPDNYRSPDYRQILRIEKTGQSITESSVLEGTFTFDSTMVEGDVFQIGTAVADQITVTLTEDLDIDSFYDIYISALQSGAARNTATWVKLGTYVISDMDTSFEGQTKVVFQDKLVTMDESVLLNTGTLYANLTAMATVSLTQEEIAFLSGISVANAQTMTKRDFIRGCGLLMWENAYITSSGAVSYRIKTTTSQSFGPSVRFNSALADPVTIGPVDVVDDSGAVIFTRGSSSGQRIVIDNSTSPMINLIGGVENLAQYYSTATIPGRGIVDFSYTPLTMTAMSSWQMEPGDVFTYVDKNNVSHTSICTSVAHVLNGASACTSTAQSKQRQSKLIPSQTDEARAIVENLSSGIDIAQTTASEAMPKYGTCSTAASTVTKSVTGISNFNLQLGTRVSLLMTNSNTANEPKLNVNSTGAKYIVTSDGSKLTTSTNGIKAWLAGSMVTFVYTRNNNDDDYVWRIDDNYALTRINHIWADTLTGTNGNINLSEGTFYYGGGKLSWDGSTFQVGGWSLDATNIFKEGTVTIDDVSTPYRVFMQAPASAVPGHAAFAVRHGSSGSYTYPFIVRYNGSLEATNATITGTINATGGSITGNMSVSGTLTGGTISGATITGEEINITGKGSVTNGSTTYNKYRTYVQTELFTDASNRSYKGIYIGADIINSSSVVTANSGIFIDPMANILVYANSEIHLGVGDQGYVAVNSTGTNIYNGLSVTGAISATGAITSSGLSATGNISATGTITENGSRLNQRTTGMAANGSVKSADTATWTSFDDTYALVANHRYLVTYDVEFTANATGIRAARATIDGSTAGNIATDRRQAISGYATFCGRTFWIQPSTSARTLGFDEYQSSGVFLNGTLRYQVIDFGV